jgi:hypothetical protein
VALREPFGSPRSWTALSAKRHGDETFIGKETNKLEDAEVGLVHNLIKVLEVYGVEARSLGAAGQAGAKRHPCVIAAGGDRP